MEKKRLQAIICVHSDEKILNQLERIIYERFNNDYVLEIAHCPSEALAIVRFLQKINVRIAAVIVGYHLPEMNGITFTKEVNRLSPITKVILLAGQLSFEIAKDAINNVDLYKFVKMPYKKEEIISATEDACFLVQQQVELEYLYEKLKESEYEKMMILDSVSKEMLFIDKDYNILWMNSITKKNTMVIEGKAKCYEKLFGRKRPCPGCEAKDVFNHSDGVSTEKEFPDQVYKLVNFYPVQGKQNKRLGVVISMVDITSRRKVEKMNLALLEVVKVVNNEESILAIYNKVYKIMKEQINLSYMCVAGKDFDNLFVEYVNGRNKTVLGEKYSKTNHDYLLNMIDGINLQIDVNPENNYIINEKEQEVEIVVGIKDKIMVLIIDRNDVSLELSYKFLRTVIEQIKVSISKIENVKKITYQANHDALTGLYNKEYFVKSIEGKMHAQREHDLGAKRYSLAVIDLNFFKEVNDTYGHIVGDEVLFAISQRILKSLRYGDILARIGGDEFAIIISRQSNKEVAVVVNRLQNVIANPVDVGNSQVQLGSSVGVVYDISNYLSAEIAIRDADMAMYEAKNDKSGIGCFKVFEVEIEEKYRQQSSIEAKLKENVNKKDMLTKYQPIICIKTGKIVGFEALIRWENDEGTIYLPNEFIPVAEESGYIEDIGRFVLDEVDRALKILNSNGENYFISVNFSAKQIMSFTHLEFLKKIDWNNNLRIDIQETSIYKNFSKINKRIEELFNLGIKVNIDDFGIGYSSLAYLEKMDINDIKIDRTFVEALTSSENSSHVVEGIISLANSFGITTIAEGVETKEQLDRLAALGCTFAQGYYISKAMSLSQIQEFIMSWPVY